jgi:hypothetical protein
MRKMQAKPEKSGNIRNKADRFVAYGNAVAHINPQGHCVYGRRRFREDRMYSGGAVWIRSLGSVGRMAAAGFLWSDGDAVAGAVAIHGPGAVDCKPDAAAA